MPIAKPGVAKPAPKAPAAAPARVPGKLPLRAAPTPEPEVEEVAPDTTDETFLAPITVLRNYTDEGALADFDAGEVVEVRKFQTAPAHVSVSVGHSAPYGRFKVGIMVSVPAYLEEMDNAAALASTLAHSYMEAEIASLAEQFPATEEGAEFAPEPEAVEDVPEEVAPVKGKPGRKPKPAPEPEPEPEPEQGDMTADVVRGYDRTQLEELVVAGELGNEGIDAADFADDEEGNASLAETIIGVYWPEEAQVADDAPAEAGYSEEELTNAAEADLKAIWAQWAELGIIEGKYPAGANEKVRKSAAVKKLLAAQEAAASA